MKRYLLEFVSFGVKQARASVFAGSFFVLLALSTQIDTGPLARYDFIFIGALVIQAALIKLKLETVDEAKVIFLFHIIGLALEIFKTHPDVGSWSYPEQSFFKVGDVPLFSGFMYAAVGSYISQAWKTLDLKLTNYPGYFVTIPLTLAIYINFFTNHWFYDIRWFLYAAIFVIFARTTVEFRPWKKIRKMPLWLSFILIGFFIWVAENISTFYGAWQYPNQTAGWDLVDIQKISSWSLLVIISFIIVADLKHLKADLKKG